MIVRALEVTRLFLATPHWSIQIAIALKEQN